MQAERVLAVFAAAMLLTGVAGVFAGDNVQTNPVQESGGTDAWREIPREDYETVLQDLGYSESEINEEVSAHSDEERVETRTLFRKKLISGNFYFVGQATVFAWRDASGQLIQKISAVRIDSITLSGYGAEERRTQAASNQTVRLSGSLEEYIAKGYYGNAEATEITVWPQTRLIVDYNGDYYFSVPQSAAVGFAEVVGVTDQEIVYRYEASGDFSWQMSEIWQEEI